MSDRPNAQELLTIARDELTTRMLSELPSSMRYQALMIANAMSIAARETVLGRPANCKELKGLQSLFGEAECIPDDDTAMQASLQQQRKRLCEQIRAGNFDTDSRGNKALQSHLAQTARAKVAISNPKLLAPKLAK